MRPFAKIVLIVVVVLASGAGAAVIHPETYGLLCESVGGKWASNHNTCVTRLCFKNRTCGYWANPDVRCNRLKADDPISEVYFQLGQPDQVDGSRHIWLERKGPGVVAMIEDEKLVSLACEG
jgi:hypothetical protein